MAVNQAKLDAVNKFYGYLMKDHVVPYYNGVLDKKKNPTKKNIKVKKEEIEEEENEYDLSSGSGFEEEKKHMPVFSITEMGTSPKPINFSKRKKNK